MEEECATLGWGQHFREYLCQRLSLEVDIGTCVTHRRVQAGVAEPLTDRREVNARLEKMDGRCVPQRMGVDSLIGECW